MEWGIEWIGMVAGVLTTCAFFPQVVKTIRSRSTGDLSWIWLVMMNAGVFFWLAYGYFRDSPSIFVANFLTLGCLLMLLYVKISIYRQSSDNATYVRRKRKVGKCFGCGQCEKGCPLIVEYCERVVEEKIPPG
jgi:MtN3 and saliva related transmembrane protein